MIVVFDQEGRIEWVNDLFTQLTGLGIEDVAGFGPEKILSNEGATPEEVADLRERATRGEVFGAEVRRPDRGGSPRWLTFDVRPILHASGRVRSLIAIGRDVTAHHQAEETLREREQRLRAIIDSTPECINMVAPDGTLLEMNPAGLELIEASSATEVIGKCAYDLVSPAHRGAFRALNEQVCQGTPGSLEFEITGLRGTRRWMDTRAVPLVTAGGATVCLGITRDVTERVHAQEEINRAAGGALETARLKSQFLANMSHEIRTPMNGILGMTELVLETDLSPEQREYVETIRSSSDALLTIINDMLDFSKIEAGKLELESIPFSPRDTLRDTLKPLAIHARRKGVELSCQFSSEVPASVLGDPGRLRQIVVNLVGNAIKFTERGEISVHVASEPRGNDAFVLRVSVSDTGIGIPAEKMSLIFEAFAQADGSTTRKYGGTGLGLAIVTQLVGMMGGRIWVESVVGTGSTFHCTLEVARDPSTRAAPLSARELRGVRTLIVDDNATNRRILSDMLRSWGMIPRAVGGGAAALAALGQAREMEEPFAIALLDVQMPLVDGFELAERIQRDPLVGETRLVLLTSSGLRGDAARCRNLGIAGYLTKPVMAAELLEAIQTVLGAGPIASSRRLVTRHTVRESRSRLRALVADDNPVNRTLAVRLLEGHGHSVVAVGDGREALDALERERFDLALFDLEMPGVNGLEATAEIRRREGSADRHLPIIALTAHAVKGDRERCLAAGMDGYVSKPLDSVALLAEIDRLVAVASRSESALRGVGKGPVVIDREAILARVGGDIGLLAEIVRIFCDDSRRLLRGMHDAAARSDAAFLERSAHRLKGALETFCARDAADAAIRLETMGRNASLDRVEDALAALETEIDALTSELSNLVERTPAL